MTGTVLLTLGRLPKGLDVARSFAAAGWRVLVADPHRRHLVGVSRSVAASYIVPSPAEAAPQYLDEIAGIANRERVDLIAPVSEEILYVAALRERVAASTRVFAMPQETLLALHDKAEFVRIARSLGLAAPVSVEGGGAAAQALCADGDVIVKPRHGCAGGGVRRIARGGRVEASADMVVQRFVSGDEHSVCALANNGVVQGCVVYRALVKSGTVAVAFERVDHAAIEAWVARFVGGMGFTGFVSFDFIVDETGAPWAIECNPRLSSGVHFMRGEDLAPAMLGLRADVRLRPERRLKQFWACLTETQACFGDWPAFRRNLGHLWREPDVSWAGRDPGPLLMMPWTAWPIIAESRARRISFGEAASRDLLWSADAIRPV